MQVSKGHMGTASYYQVEAQRCRQLAAQSIAGSIMCRRWLTLAAEYETLADALDDAPLTGPTQQQPMQRQQQPIQQQQQKNTESDK